MRKPPLSIARRYLIGARPARSCQQGRPLRSNPLASASSPSELGLSQLGPSRRRKYEEGKRDECGRASVPRLLPFLDGDSQRRGESEGLHNKKEEKPQCLCILAESMTPHFSTGML